MKITNIIILFLAISIFSACKKDKDEKPAEQKIKITEATAQNGTKVTLWADKDQLTVGYNPIYLTVTNENTEVKDAVVTVHPEMDMHTMSHSSPVEQPVYNALEGKYAGAVVFTMPSGDMGSWKLTVEVNELNIDLNVTVANSPSNTRFVGTFTGADAERYVISLVNPLMPKTGMNDLEILVNKRTDSGHSFPPVDDFQIEFNPQMTSMGHGSPNNVYPVNVGKGKYKGKVNFTMTGDWRLFFTLKRNGEVIVGGDNTYLDIWF